jgi:orotate phosphoribosyltransferase
MEEKEEIIECKDAITMAKRILQAESKNLFNTLVAGVTTSTTHFNPAIEWSDPSANPMKDLLMLKMQFEGEKAKEKAEEANKIAELERAHAKEMEESERLKGIIKEKALIVKEDAVITLTSGLKSNYFFDMKTVLLSMEGTNLITKEILKRLENVQFDYIGGMESGAIPIVTLISANSAVLGGNKDGFFVRKQEKNYGERKSDINNKIEGNLRNNTNVVIVDDVTTTGGSIMDAIKEVEQFGCKIVKVITIVDRSQGAKEKLAEYGIEFNALYTAEDFGL